MDLQRPKEKPPLDSTWHGFELSTVGRANSRQFMPVNNENENEKEMGNAQGIL